MWNPIVLFVKKPDSARFRFRDKADLHRLPFMLSNLIISVVCDMNKSDPISFVDSAIERALLQFEASRSTIPILVALMQE